MGKGNDFPGAVVFGKVPVIVKINYFSHANLHSAGILLPAGFHSLHITSSVLFSMSGFEQGIYGEEKFRYNKNGIGEEEDKT